jgi:hypothetical protein
MSEAQNTSNYLLRVEGVNLYAFIEDTNDLNTQRGAGLILLDAVKKVVPKILKDHGIDSEFISQGASVGLYQVATNHSEDLKMKIVKGLRDHPECATATFLVNLEELTNPNDFLQVNENLLAGMRAEQYQMSSLSFPSPSDQEGICELDGIRPKQGDLASPEKDRKQKNCSSSVRIRRSYGQDQKQSFYQAIRGLEGLGQFAQSFEDIATDAPKEFSNLNNKLAVFYADGNSFSTIFRDKIKAAKDKIEGQKEIDAWVQGNRETWLTDFLLREVLENTHGWMGKIHEGQHQRIDCYRFETLLWGGDEVMFVIPAWRAWAFARHFFSMADDWKLGDIRLTHTASLVFCHHKAPISRLKSLAREMVDAAKDRDGGRESDELLITVMESFDHLGGDYSAAIARRYKNKLGFADVILRGEKLSESLATLAESRALLAKSENFPRSQLRSLVRGIIDGNKTAAARSSAFRNASEADNTALTAWMKATGCKKEQAALILLEELWDYALS